jgi:hypothetical protein
MPSSDPRAMGNWVTCERGEQSCWMIAADERGWACEFMLGGVKPVASEWYTPD